MRLEIGTLHSIRMTRVRIAIVLTSAHSSTFSSVRGKNLGHILPGKALQIFEYALGRSGEIQLAVNQERRREK